MESHDGYTYYIIFVDHFTKYIWFFPLKRKLNVYSIFIQFKTVMEIFFQKPIISFYSNIGGEFVKLKEFFRLNGITQFLTPLHAPEHNSYAKCRHRHRRETSLASQVGLPFEFLTYAFFIVVYLINRLSIPTLQLHSPYELLFQKSLNYEKIHVFGCLC